MLQNTQLYQSDKTAFNHIYHWSWASPPNFTLVSDRSRPLYVPVVNVFNRFYILNNFLLDSRCGCLRPPPNRLRVRNTRGWKLRRGGNAWIEHTNSGAVAEESQQVSVRGWASSGQWGRSRVWRCRKGKAEKVQVCYNYWTHHIHVFQWWLKYGWKSVLACPDKCTESVVFVGTSSTFLDKVCNFWNNMR